MMAETRSIRKIRPQAGYQTKALSSPADIIIGGAMAGVGKTFTLLLDFVRHYKVPRWGGVIFRRTSPQIRNEGGLWDTSMELYPLLGAQPAESSLTWTFPAGPKMKFSHLEYEKNKLDWQGAQVPYMGFDELTHFTETMFFYLLSRSRSTCGIRPVVRATCNPDPDSWVAELIAWWIDQETGLPIPERDGVIRYFFKIDKEYIWGNTFGEVFEQCRHIIDPMMHRGNLPAEVFIKSLTFISGSIYDNKELLDKDPGYLANLLAQPAEVKAALYDGSWKAIVNDKDIFGYHNFRGVFDNVMEIAHIDRYITADIALEGADKFIIGVWYGKELVDIEIIEKSKGNDIIDRITAMATKHEVVNSNICFDADGVGGFAEGYIPGAIPFHNGGAARSVREPTSGNYIQENYKNWKTQCYYRAGKAVDKGEYKISKEVADRMYDEKMTVRQRFMFERKSIKRDKIDQDLKLCINKKADQKIFLGGESPDLMDMFMMREAFDLYIQFVVTAS